MGAVGVESEVVRPTERWTRRYPRLQLAGWAAQIGAVITVIVGAVMGGGNPTYGSFADPCGSALRPRIDPFDLSAYCPPEVFGSRAGLAVAAFWIAAGLLVLSVLLQALQVWRSPRDKRASAVWMLGRAGSTAGVVVLLCGLVTGMTDVVTMDSVHVGDCGPALFHFMIEPPTELCAPEFYHPYDTIALVLLLAGLGLIVVGIAVSYAAGKRQLPRERTLST